MTRDTRIDLFLMGELVAALRAIETCLIKLLLSGDLWLINILFAEGVHVASAIM